MNDAKKVNALVMRSILVLIPVFIVPALVAVYIIKSMDLAGMFALVPLGGALLVSWLVVFRLMSWSRRTLGSITDNKKTD